MVQAVPPHHQGKSGTPPPARILHHGAELTGGQQSIAFWEALTCCAQTYPGFSTLPGGSGGQSRAALGAPATQDRTAADGAHAGAESVRAFTADLARLVRSFHDYGPW